MNTVLSLRGVSLYYPMSRKTRKKGVPEFGISKINLELSSGTSLGIIGRNGSGKSTLLKVMAGVFPPDTGEILVKGSISLLSGVGVGFHRDLTGRENSYLYGALMGKSEKETSAHIEEIKDFSELNHHFELPMRIYSSGMKARLGISVATAFKPEILMIDEVLGVGDISFKEKSQDRVKKMISESGTVIIVSHSMAFIKQLCDEIIVMEKGSIYFRGDPEEGVKQYMSLLSLKDNESK